VTGTFTTHPLLSAGEPQIFQCLQHTLCLQADSRRTDLLIEIEAMASHAP
jgi:hypothetical protein